MNWFERFVLPWQVLPDIQADVFATRNLVSQLPTRSDLNALEATMTSNEQQSRDDLAAAITGALGAYDNVVAERDQLKTALEQADAGKAQEIADAVAAANASNDAGDAEFNESQVEALRRLQPTVTPDPTPEPAPADPPVDTPPVDGPADPTPAA